MSIKSVINDTASSESFINAQKPLPPTISGYSVGGLDDTALDPAGGQTVQINGTGFLPGATITFDGSAVAVVTFSSANRLTFTSPAKSAGTYTIYVVNPDGGTAIYIPGIIYSVLPTWTTSAGSLGSYYETTSISNTVVASGDAPITYSLYSGSLPTGATLAANGVITGTAPVDSSSTTYSFTIEAIDAQLQGSTRSFSLTINTDVVTWVSPANNTTYTTPVDSAIANVTLSATDAAGYAVTYTANALPTGLSLTGANISGTPTVIADSSTLLTATAATTNRTAVRTINWSITVANDPYFEYNTLLIPGASSTFVADASTNNFAVTINGDTKPNSLNPYTPGYYSNYFDGAGDGLSIPASVGLAPLTGDYTYECWVYPTSSSGSYRVIFGIDNYGSGEPFRMYQYGTNFQFWYTGSNFINSNTITVNTWYHLAATRSSGVIKFFVNGTQVGSNVTSTLNYPSSIFRIGKDLPGTYPFVGYISNLRAIKGTAIYTSNFTPSTTPLTAISGTSLLTCQSNRFIDNSTNNFTLTVAGNTTVNSFDPFVPNSSYSTYGSGYFDGSGDYLSIPDNSAFALGSSNFTMEAWIYPTATGDFPTIAAQYGSGISSFFWSLGPTANPNDVYFYAYISGSTPTLQASNVVVLNTWTHHAVVRNSTTLTYYINGISVATTSIGSSAIIDSTRLFTIGSSGTTDYTNFPFTGYITDVRVVKGTAVYTTAFTPPSAPLTAIANTSLLTLQNNQSVNNNVFLDNSTNNFFVTRNGNTTQGTFSPYGGNWSNYFDGTGDYLSLSTTTALQMSGDFTWEAWVYPTSLPSGANYKTLWAQRSQAATIGGPAVVFDSTGKYLLFISNSAASAWANSGFNPSLSVSLNQWQHIALVKNGTALTLYKNGVAGTATTSSQAVGTSGNTTLMAGAADGSQTVDGYMSNFRIVKGTAVYTSNFTPSTTPLTPITNTSLLTCADNRLVDDSINNFTITKNGDVTVQRFSPFNPSSLTPTSYSGYFGTANGNGLYLSDTTNGIALSGNFTIEMWLYPTGASSSGYSVITTANASAGIFQYYYNSAGKIGYYTVSAGAVLTSNAALTFNTWQHVALVRSSNVVKVYVNGVEQTWASAITDSTTVYANYISGIGTTYNIYGYASNFRVTTTAVYTTTFTPPTSPLTAISGTQLLTLQSSTFIDNSTNNYTIYAVGSPTPSQQNPFGFTSTTTQGYTTSSIGGSGYFDGTGDYLSVTGTALNLVTGDFTIEVWAYIVAGSTYQFIIGSSDNSAGYMMIGINVPLSPTSTIAIGRSGINWPVQFGSSITFISNTWSHIAITRSGTTNRAFINGVQLGTNVTDSTSWSFPSNTMWAGFQSGGTAFNGYMTDLRIVKGTAVYTSAFVPPITPLTALQNTVLLNNMTGAGIYDASTMNNMETVGNAQLSTAINKFGGSSMSFDGTGDYLLSIATPSTNLSTGDFTIEFWVYPQGSGYFPCMVWWGNSSDNSYAQVYFTYDSGTNAMYLLCGSPSGGWLINTTGGAITPNAWQHIAIVRYGSAFTLYKNGVSTLTGTSSAALVPAPISNYIGSRVGNVQNFTGYIDDFRVTKGYARYTSNFTPPATAFSTY